MCHHCTKSQIYMSYCALINVKTNSEKSTVKDTPSPNDVPSQLSVKAAAKGESGNTRRFRVLLNNVHLKNLRRTLRYRKWETQPRSLTTIHTIEYDRKRNLFSGNPWTDICSRNDWCRESLYSVRQQRHHERRFKLCFS